MGGGERRILEFEDCDVVVLRLASGYCAFNNSGPHLHLPFFERRVFAKGDEPPFPADSTISDDLAIVCRWHLSSFDLQTGEIRDWATKLTEEGLSPGMEHMGDISKNRCKLTLYGCRIEDGDLWITLD